MGCAAFPKVNFDFAVDLPFFLSKNDTSLVGLTAELSCFSRSFIFKPRACTHKVQSYCTTHHNELE